MRGGAFRRYLGNNKSLPDDNKICGDNKIGHNGEFYLSHSPGLSQ